MTKFNISIVYYCLIGLLIISILKYNKASTDPIMSISLRCPPNYRPLIDPVLSYHQTDHHHPQRWEQREGCRTCLELIQSGREPVRRERKFRKLSAWKPTSDSVSQREEETRWRRMSASQPLSWHSEATATWRGRPKRRKVQAAHRYTGK